jgi:hypothetical protein
MARNLTTVNSTINTRTSVKQQQTTRGEMVAFKPMRAAAKAARHTTTPNTYHSPYIYISQPNERRRSSCTHQFACQLVARDDQVARSNLLCALDAELHLPYTQGDTINEQKTKTKSIVFASTFELSLIVTYTMQQITFFFKKKKWARSNTRFEARRSLQASHFLALFDPPPALAEPLPAPMLPMSGELGAIVAAVADAPLAACCCDDCCVDESATDNDDVDVDDADDNTDCDRADSGCNEKLFKTKLFDK